MVRDGTAPFGEVLEPRQKAGSFSIMNGRAGLLPGEQLRKPLPYGRVLSHVAAEPCANGWLTEQSKFAARPSLGVLMPAHLQHPKPDCIGANLSCQLAERQLVATIAAIAAARQWLVGSRR